VSKVADPIVLYDLDDKVAVITLNRPDKLNAISAELQHHLLEAFHRADDDPVASVVLLRAVGRSFCAGYDIGAKEPGKDDWRSDPTKAHEHLKVQLDFEMAPWLMKKPVIAAVQGHVMGGGCELVMLCDLTIAADNAVFGEPEVRFSSVGPAIVMPAIIGYKKARELLYFGDTIDAPTALSLGMINRIAPLGELDAASRRWAKRLSLISPEALYAAKRAINRTATPPVSARRFMPGSTSSARFTRRAPSSASNSATSSPPRASPPPSAGAPPSSRNSFHRACILESSRTSR
jgi:enoyl-CoA hydratase